MIEIVEKSFHRSKESNVKKLISPSDDKQLKPREISKKIYKLAIRKLPVRNFHREDLINCIRNVCSDINLNGDNFNVEHFVEGKISRKRGPVFGAGFVSVLDEGNFVSFLNSCPSKYPLIAVDDMNSQPEVIVAPNQRTFKTKGKVDKYADTFDSDATFLQFKLSFEKPIEKLLSAELQYDHKKNVSSSVDGLTSFEQMRNNPLLKFLREKGERKVLERKAARLKARGLVSAETSVVGGSSSKKASSKVVKTKKSSSARAKPDQSNSVSENLAHNSSGVVSGKIKVLARDSTTKSSVSTDSAGTAAVGSSSSKKNVIESPQNTLAGTTGNRATAETRESNEPVDKQQLRRDKNRERGKERRLLKAEKKESGNDANQSQGLGVENIGVKELRALTADSSRLASGGRGSGGGGGRGRGRGKAVDGEQDKSTLN